MTRIATFAAAFLLAVGLANPVSAAPIVYQASLSGANEAVPNNSAATGFALVTVDAAAHTMRVQLTFAGLDGDSTAAHIHCCTAAPLTGVVGVASQTPSFAGFPTGNVSGAMDTTFDTTLSSSFAAAFITANGGTPAGAEAALFAGLAAGTAYVNIHTSIYPAGEIRGFLVPAPEPASLGLLGAGLAGLAMARRRRVPAVARN